VQDANETVLFAELGRRAERMAGALARRGLARARVGLLAEPGSSWVEAFFGIVLSGGTVVPLSPHSPPAENRWALERSGARGLVVSAPFASVDWAPGTCPVLDAVAMRDEPGQPGEPGAVGAESVALVLHTSGTTGKPKGALLTHANVAAQAELLGRAWGFSERDSLLHILPLHHLHGLGVALMVSLLSGACTRFIGRFDVAVIWERLADATVLMGVPTQHKKLFDAYDAADAATRARWAANGQKLRLVTSGSAGLPPALGERWRAIAGQYPLERYGMTEAGIALSNPLHGARRPGSCGQVVPGMEVRIVDEAGRDVPPGEPGEIWMGGPTVFAGYDEDEEATARSFEGRWLKSGDTAMWLDDRFVQVLGRTSVDILKSGGYKLSAIEIETALRDHDAIEDVAVVGIADETWGDLVVAAVVPRAGRAAEVDEKPLRQWAKERLASYKVPKRVVVVDDFPRNALGKVMKANLALDVERLLGRS
jgi:malonyl-CoA/methylmalonyl-CoA synthetase